MALAGRLSRYAHFVRLLARHGRTPLASDDAQRGEPSSRPDDADAFARDLEDLGPTFIKLGQLLASRSDLLDPRYVTALERLQDDVEPFPFEDAITIVEDELRVRPSKVFADIDRKPIAAASLAQVHRAVLRDGRRVAVKVQRPNVRERVLEDLEALDEVVHLLARFNGEMRHIDLPATMDEFRRTLIAELDYRQESRNLVELAAQLRGFTRIVVPQPIDDFTTARVLTMDYVEGTKITRVNPVVWTEIDSVALADDLFRAYLQQVLVDGMFHADPHPGNVLLTPDHKLALIDLGMVGRVSSRMRESLFRLMLAAADRRTDDAATAVIAMGERLEEFDESRVRRDIADLLGRHQDATAKDLPVGRVMLELARNGHRHGLRVAPEFAMLGKTLLNLDEIGRVLDPGLNVNAALRRHASAIMRRRAARALTPARLFSSTLELRELAQHLPARLNRILDALAGNNLRVNVELIDHGAIIDGLQKVANRIALGLVLAALIVGAAMLMQVPTRFTIFGYPGIAMLLFLAAAAGGFWLIWTVLAGDVRRRRVR